MIRALAASWLDLLFPPLCTLCKERGKSLLCNECQEWLSPLDPNVRCSHCFRELNHPSPLCPQCAKSPNLKARHAFAFEESPICNRWKALLMEDDGPFLEMAASLLVLLWGKLNWPMPDQVSIIPSLGQIKPLEIVAETVSSMLGRSFFKEFSLKWESFSKRELERVSEDLLEDKTVLLIAFEEDKNLFSKALSHLFLAYPKEVLILSLFTEKRGEG